MEEPAPLKIGVDSLDGPTSACWFRLDLRDEKLEPDLLLPAEDDRPRSVWVGECDDAEPRSLPAWTLLGPVGDVADELFVFMMTCWSLDWALYPIASEVWQRLCSARTPGTV